MTQEASAVAQQRNAELQLSRNREAAASGAVTQSEIDELEANNEMAKASVFAARAAKESAEAQRSAAIAALRDAELDLTYTEVQSPITGRVGRTLVDVGNLVGANEATHLTTVIRYDPIYAYYSISESVLLQWIEWQDEGRVAKPEQLQKMRERKVFLALANEQGYPHEGRFDYADLGVDESSGTYMVRAVFDNPDRQIPPGSFVRIQVPLFPEEVLLVDEVAIGRDQAGAYVLVVDNQQTVERRGVEVGERYDGMRVIEAGLTTADNVVVNGLQWARPGGKVAPQMVEMKSPASAAAQGPAVKETASNQSDNGNTTPSPASEG